MFFVGLVWVLPIVFLAAVLLAEIFIPRRCEYCLPDKLGAVFNCILAFIYPVLWYFSLWLSLTPMMAYESAPMGIIFLIALLGILVFVSSIVGLTLSMAFRKRGESKKSFLLQFIGVIAFGAQLVIYFVCGLLV